MLVSIILGTSTLFASLVSAAPQTVTYTTTTYGYPAAVHQLFDPTPTGSPIVLARSEPTMFVLKLKRTEPVPREFLVDTIPSFRKRNPVPQSGPPPHSCGPSNSGQTCSGDSAGPCCSEHGWCGGDGYYCGGGCQAGYGTCVVPYLQLQFDADSGDVIWDPVTDNVFLAEPGDGMIYYGKEPVGTPAGSTVVSTGWPNPDITQTITK